MSHHKVTPYAPPSRVHLPHMQEEVGQHSVWGTLILCEEDCLPVAADDVVFVFTKSKVILRISSTSFTCAVQFASVQRVHYIEAMNRIELHARCNDENFGLSRRMYVLQPQDARQTLSVYELILRHVPRDTLLCSRVLHHAWEATPIVVNHLLQPLLTPETLRLTGFYMLEATEEVPLPIANTSATVPQSTINTAVQRRIRPAASNGDENRDRIDPNFFSSLLNETAAGDSSRLVFSYIEEERLPSLPGPSVPPAMFAVDTDLYDIQYGSIHQL